MNENNNVNVNNVNSYEQESELIKTQEELTGLLKSVKNGEQIDEKYKNCMKEDSFRPCVGLFCRLRDGFIARGVIKNVDDIFQHLVLGSRFVEMFSYSFNNYNDRFLICRILSLICQPKFDIKKIKKIDLGLPEFYSDKISGSDLRRAVAAFDVDATKKNNTKYIFNLKEQMALGLVSPKNYSAKSIFKIFCYIGLSKI